MKNMKKILVVALAIAMLALAAVAGTMAWLHDNEEAEVAVTAYGDVEIEFAATTYTGLKLVPNCSYNMAPTVTVADANNEDCYIRILVTFTDAADIIDTMGIDTDADDVKDTFLAHVCTPSWRTEVWSCDADSFYWDKAADTITYEFRYVENVNAAGAYIDTDAAVELTPLFTDFILPYYLNDEDVAALAEMTVRFEAQAMQAVKSGISDTAGNITKTYFANADEAWAEFDSQVAGAINNPNSTNVDPTGTTVNP